MSEKLFRFDGRFNSRIIQRGENKIRNDTVAPYAVIAPYTDHDSVIIIKHEHARVFFATVAQQAL